MEKPGIIIVGHHRKPGVAEQIESLRPWLAKRVDILADYALNELPAALPADLCNVARLCVVFGGDGTILSTGRCLAQANLPLVGVNMGKLGFLAEFNVEHLQKHFAAILAGEVASSERMMLDVTVYDGNCPDGTKAFTCTAANDIAFSAGPPFRMINLQVVQGKHEVANYFGDGLVVATPTGSTGYNMSSGGPIVQPTVEGIIVTPLSPHTLALRPMVLQPDQPIHVTALHANEGTSLIVDGQVPHRLCSHQVVEITRSPHRLRLISHPGRSYFETLSRKLHWGRGPHRSGQ